MNYSEILKSVIITEKGATNVKKGNKYTFLITDSATKGQVKEAVETLYKVKVISVNTLKNKGKIKRSMVKNRVEFKTSYVKKAIVQLDPKNTLKFYDGGKE
ncbi:50S ribosomal protein L23 [candidate division WWE3 bacterium CG_4_9_14_0_2_um_filter_35_11]|uniref:Large ribosomal subunit protein uL23 n=1 Tax=candidate division WWE3 bacterium CG_4_9_14_0_2_um_filter_35_11 TaxID=1975077 RepID=A0A2M8EL05_UNCKA|nr:MAG: 50S ribosomal protein L23 [candidate division WWE3 bacterium CG_4_9_14_0_2_um_filter_35_11]